MIVLVAYVLLGLGVSLWMYGTGLYHDWTRGKEPKLGFRWKNPIVIGICVATAIPIINVIFAFLIIGAILKSEFSQI
jgi:hypothetical protein